MAVALPYISSDFQLTPVQSGALMSAFFVGYSLMHIPGGVLADKFGVRRVAAGALVWWSAFTAITGVAANFMQMLWVRLFFGLGEGMFPACAFKTIAIWFSKKERATANAIMLAANPLGIALSPIIVVAIMSAWGWRGVFFALFVPGIVVALLFWMFIPDNPPDSRQAEGEHGAAIDNHEGENEAPSESEASWIDLLRLDNIHAYFSAYFTYAITVWGFTVWLPSYLVNEKGLSMTHMGLAASAPFLVGAIGCITGGWISDRFFRSRRKIPIVVANLIAALCLFLAYMSESVAFAVVCQTVAGFFLMTFLSSFWALPMNTIPKTMMGAASGFINMAGQIAGIVSPILIGYLIEISGGQYGIAWLFMVGCLIASCLVVMTIRLEPEVPQEQAVHQ